MASTDVNHAQIYGRSTNSTDSKDSTGSDPYTCFESVKVKDKLSSSNDSSIKSTDSQCCSQCHEESRINRLAASHHSGPYENPVLSKATEEIEASNRAIVPTNTHNEGRGQVNQGFADSGPFQSIQEDSLNSIFTDTDITSTTYIMRPDIHVPKDKYNLPRFTTPIGELQYQPRKTECTIPWRDSGPWTPINHSLSVVETETVIEPPNGFAILDSIEDTETVIEPPSEIDILDSIEDTETVFGPPTGISMRNNSEDDFENYHKSSKNCPLRIMILIIVIGCISGGVTWVIYNKYFLGSKDTPTVITVDLPDFPDKCENDISIARVGEQMCIPYTQKFTSSPTGIHVRQLSSQYLSILQGFSVNVSSDEFEQQNGSWIINFNSSRTDQQLRFMKGKATCDSVGIYEITIEYDDGNVSSSEFEIKLKDPQLQHSVTRINDSIHVHCEMIKTCVASSLALFVNDGGSSRMIPNMNVCSDNHQESGTTVSADAIIPASWFSGNMTISCVPLMTDPGLAANLTSTTRIPVCEGDCVPNCTDDPQSEAYFPDKNDCTKFYQCSNGKLVFQTCASTTYWSPSECTCDHFDDEICNKDTNKFFKPLLAIEKCTKTLFV
ncbi:uncharacterized protein [Mytilus edulis]|uniref:uncharacterized protein isoform X2 n=1 Tax=Mytilus edulis TaxID=6550 RepID=UPI0039EFA77A